MHDPGSSTSCLDDDKASAYLGGALSQTEVASVEAHIDVCAACRRRLSELARADVEPTRQGAPAADLERPSEARRRAVGNLTGQTLAHFRVIRRIGEGGMGVVYEALDEKLGRSVALKLLPESLAKDPARRARLVREARLAAAVTHPNIAAVFEVGESDDRVYIAMELVDGRSLGELESGRLPVLDALRIARAVALALGRAHEKRIVHRDLKPRNVMLTRRGEVKILDFGVAKMQEEGARQDTETSITVEGHVIGTPSYMSPEQAMGAPLDARTDVFSLGVMLYEMLAGVRPFRGDTSVAVLLAIATATPEPLTAMNPDVPATVERVVLRCLEKTRASRYANGQELADAIGELLPESSASSPAARWSVRPAEDGSLGSVGTVLATSVRTAQAARTRRRLAALLASTAAAIAAVAWWIGARMSSASPLPKTPPTPNGADSPFVRLTDLPPPSASSPQALDAYLDGMRALHDGLNASYRLFDKAVELDPHFAAAGLRQAEYFFAAEEVAFARAGYRLALAGRDSLQARDQAILSALEPAGANDPPLYVQSAERLLALYRTDPRDEGVALDVIGLLVGSAGGHVELLAPKHLALVQELDDTLTKTDPSLGNAWRTRAEIAWAAGRADEAQQIAEKCIEAAPRATNCLTSLIQLASSRGDCATVASAARRFLALTPDDGWGANFLPEALAAMGQPEEAVRAAIAQVSVPGADAARFAAWWDVKLAVLTGDFVTADAAARRVAEAVSPVVDARMIGTAVRVEIAEERGDKAGAAAMAKDFLRRMKGFAPPDLGEDPTPELLAAERAGGVLSGAEFATDVEAWRADWRKHLGRDLPPVAWLASDAIVALDPPSARDAIAAMPAAVPLHEFSALIGHLYGLAGRPGEARPLLEEASRSCVLGRRPLAREQARLELGRTFEALGDTPSACRAYDGVISAWGRARPRSVTADEARVRAKALACTASSKEK